ncbi:hypothetical protein MATL_G00227230 [Megalops atlanticus]|uniref:Mitochondrial import receptor subunit TOM7 homolog n=1 Tax=Megalops atlanticus TaxID=7932 RepID=A0A9D3PG69_MEGAT|nr:hypothetical protein MATL_G00227230 [Megalops atlanticus]
MLRHSLRPWQRVATDTASNMAKLSKETKQRLQQVFQCGQFVIRWGFIPTVLYLGQYGPQNVTISILGARNLRGSGSGLTSSGNVPMAH